MTWRGFTLAEVLITLGIIGIVAALTMPSLINNVRNKQYESGFKAAYSIMAQALTYLVGQDLYTPGEICTTKNPGYEQYGRISCVDMLKEAFEGINALGSTYSKSKYFTNYKTFSNDTFDTGVLNDGYFELKNGMFVYVETPGYTTVPIISVDTNGAKKPNRFGYDTFAFIIEKGKVYPLGSPMADYVGYKDLNTYCSPDSADTRNGFACAYRAFSENDYFKNLK
jgi:prepilin-type N-terminal cleavage/methylation domain-containing protein